MSYKREVLIDKNSIEHVNEYETTKKLENCKV